MPDDRGIFPKFPQRQVTATVTLDGEQVGEQEVIEVSAGKLLRHFEVPVIVKRGGKSCEVRIRVEFDPPLYGDR